MKWIIKENGSMSHEPVTPAERRSLALGVGFGIATIMWAIGYVAFMQPGLILGELVFAAELLVVVAGGAWAGRLLGSIRSGIGAGLVSGIVNLLIVGSIVRSGDSTSLLIWIVGLLVVSAVLGGIGAAFGRRWFNQERLAATSPTGLFSMVAATTVFVLIVTGGLVTGMEAGLAVPDWPNSFGHNMLLYPLSEMTGGIFYEHAHRLYGMLVGFTAITLLVMVFIHDQRSWVRTLATLIFVMVCLQGLMGGLRVTGHLTTSQTDVRPSTILAIAHGMFGQFTFAAFVLLAIVSSRRWRGVELPITSPFARLDRTWSSLLVGALVFQLFLGACYRHFATPPLDGAPKPVPPAWAMHGHLTFSIVVLITALIAGLRAKARSTDGVPMVPVLGSTVNLLVGIQMTLGILAFVSTLLRTTAEIPIWELVPTSAHQANGALLLATAAALVAAVHRFEGVQDVPAVAPIDDRVAGPVGG